MTTGQGSRERETEEGQSKKTDGEQTSPRRKRSRQADLGVNLFFSFLLLHDPNIPRPPHSRPGARVDLFAPLGGRKLQRKKDILSFFFSFLVCPFSVFSRLSCFSSIFSRFTLLEVQTLGRELSSTFFFHGHEFRNLGDA
jgi:hypothetical protein